DHVVLIHPGKAAACAGCAGGHGVGGLVELVGLLNGAGLLPGAAVGIEGVGEVVDLHVGVGVGLDAALDEGQADGAVVDGVAVLAVFEQAHAVAALGEVHPLLAAALEPGFIPAG